MSGSGHPGKRPTPCRFFTSGTCVYGDNCRNLHQQPSQPSIQHAYQNGPPHMDNTAGLEEMVGGGGVMGGSGDQYFNATFNPAPGSNINDFSPFRRGGRPGSGMGHLSQSAKPFVPTQGPMDQTLANDFAALNLASSMAGGDFPPLQPASLPHSSSTPSFAALNSMFNQPPPPSSTPVSHTVNNGGGLAYPSGLSPSHSPGISPSGSPHMFRRNPNPSSMPTPHRQTTHPQKSSAPMCQENVVGGTTYFYNPEDYTPQTEGVSLPPFTMFHSTPAYLKHMKLKGSPTFFMADEIKTAILNRQSLSYAACDPALNTEVPQEVDNYDSLVPLEPGHNPSAPVKSSLGYVSTCYKAHHKKEGTLCCLRRIHNFRINPTLNNNLMTLVETWSKVYHPNIVQLREAFTTKAFGDSSVVVSYDFLPGAETLMAHRFTNMQSLNGFSPDFTPNSRGFTNQGPGVGNQSKGLSETEIWSYIVQLCSALRCIHGAGLAARTIEPTKILHYGKGRLRINCVGIMDILTLPTIDQNAIQSYIHHWQQEDLTGLGRIVLALAYNSAWVVHGKNITQAIESITRMYSVDLKNLVSYLFETRKPRSVNDLMPMIGARFFTQLDLSQLRGDMLEDELSKEVENGRLCRIMMKLFSVLERAEFNMDPSWSETGDRYMLKLFRDFVFHAVDENGVPWLDMAHMVSCLNKLDAGDPEKILLSSQDETSVFIVSYAELKRQFVSAFNELMTMGQSLSYS